MTEVKSEWDGEQTIGSITLPADPIVGFPTKITEVVVSGWDEIDRIDRFDNFPCAFVFVTDLSPIVEIAYEQEEADRVAVACGIRIVDQQADETILEKTLYRVVDAVYRMVRHNMFLNASGWAVEQVSKAYSAVEPYQSMLFKAGQVSFIVEVNDAT